MEEHSENNYPSVEATFKFKLPELQSEFKVYAQAPAMHSALWDIEQLLRSWRKYGIPDDISKEQMMYRIEELYDDIDLND
jgi:hypothetical protein